MQWALTSYTSPEPGKVIKPSFCHPFAYKARNVDVCTRHGVTVDKIKRVDNLHIDFGGAVFMKEPAIEFPIGAQRTFSCWTWQASGVIDLLQSPPLVRLGWCDFYKFAQWPGMLCFISRPDRDKILRGLRDRSAASQ